MLTTLLEQTGRRMIPAVSLVRAPFAPVSIVWSCAIAKEGMFASAPVIVNDLIYVTTMDDGNAVMGSTTFQMCGSGNHHFIGEGEASTYLYLCNTEGLLVSRREIR